MSLPKAIFEEISSKINEILQNNPAKDIEKNIKSILNSALTKIDVVTHDDFLMQQRMLQKLAGKVTELEQRIATLEKNNTILMPNETVTHTNAKNQTETTETKENKNTSLHSPESQKK